MRKKYEKQSKSAIRFLERVKEELKLDFIQHARNGGEFKIGRYRADGYHADTKTIFEFHGSLSHGSPLHYDAGERLRKFGNTTAGTRFKNTLKRESNLRALGFNLAVIWDFEYKDGITFLRWIRKVRNALRYDELFYISSTVELPQRRLTLPRKLSIKKIQEF